ncbi:hypothetical protein [Kistimonas asteriae]|uniref:hypothetical protein n=1 Tax=Kistimonas asteriae TaxID=517724 RepID=UPI001BA6A3FC|nr:hypothetical protein [Kistimonas asteriae]
MRYLISSILLMFSFSLSAAEPLQNQKAMQALVETVMKDVGKGNLKDGMERLKPYVLFPVTEMNAQVSQVERQMPLVLQRYGKPVGFDLIKVEEAGNSLIQYAYLQKFEKHALVWRFIFYQSNGQWMLNHWSFDDKVKMLFWY